MHVPAKFKLLNREFVVEVMSDEAHKASDTVGNASMTDGVITVYPGGDRTFIEHTFLHELVHMMLETAGRADLSEDEALVDLLSAALHQFLQTKKGRVYF